MKMPEQCQDYPIYGSTTYRVTQTDSTRSTRKRWRPLEVKVTIDLVRPAAAHAAAWDRLWRLLLTEGQ